MPRHHQRRKKSDSDEPDGPIQPGSPLYLMLQRIARAVAENLISNSNDKEKKRKRGHDKPP